MTTRKAMDPGCGGWRSVLADQEKKTTIVGVGLILCTLYLGNIRVLVTEETRDKPLIRKRKGMRSIPFETVEERDGDNLVSVMERCAHEELGIETREMHIFGAVPEAFRLFPEVTGYDIVTRYGIAEYLGDEQRRFVAPAGDTRVVGWMTVKELMGLPPDTLRVETRPVMEHFIKYLPKLFRS